MNTNLKEVAVAGASLIYNVIWYFVFMWVVNLEDSAGRLFQIERIVFPLVAWTSWMCQEPLRAFLNRRISDERRKEIVFRAVVAIGMVLLVVWFIFEFRYIRNGR
jgi:hypothetical protein